MNKDVKKNYVKKVAVVGIAAVACMSLFACKKPEAPIPNADIRIDVDADINDGNSINEKEETIKGSNNGRTENDGNNLLNTDKWIVKDGKTYNKATGELRTMEEAIGNLEIIERDEHNTPKGNYTKSKVLDENGYEWKVTVVDKDRQVSRLIDKDGRETMVSGTIETAEQLIAQANAMDNISRNMGSIK